MNNKAIAEQEIVAFRQKIVANFQENWARMIKEWERKTERDAFWLMHSANYLFNSRDIKWAIDPIRPWTRVQEETCCDTGNDLKTMDFVLLTHAHGDHVDVGLWHQLPQKSCTWVVPEHMESFFEYEAGMGASNYIIAVPGGKIQVAGVEITPFVSPHSEYRPGKGYKEVDSTGYLVETSASRLLFPGDVRTYDPEYLEPFKPISAVFAHVFLGRSAALEPHPPLLSEFVDFYLQCCPSKIILAHLNDLGRLRPAANCWTDRHAEMVQNAFNEAASSIRVFTSQWFSKIVL